MNSTYLLQFADKCSPRKFQQVLGGAGRFVDEDFWVKFQKGKSGIFTDVRFENEADTMDYIVNVDNPKISMLMYVKMGNLDRSELFALNIHEYTWRPIYEIYNHTGLSALKEQCNKYVEFICS